MGRLALRPGSWAADFERLVGAWLLHRDERATPLRDLAQDQAAAPSVRRSAYRRLAYQLRADSRLEDVEQTLTVPRTLPGGDIGLNRYQHALTLIQLGRFHAAQDLMTQLREEQAVKRGGWLVRLRGELAVQHGDPAAAADAIAKRAELFETRGSWKLVTELRVVEARLRALIDPATPAVDGAIEIASHYAAFPDLRGAWCAKALAAAGDADAVHEAMAQARRIALQAARPERSYSVVLAEWFDAAVRVDRAFFDAPPDALDAGERGRPVDVTAVRDGFRHSARVVIAAAATMTKVFAGFILPTTPSSSRSRSPSPSAPRRRVLIRMTVIPALMSLLGERARRVPNWLDRIVPHVDIEGTTLEKSPTGTGRPVWPWPRRPPVRRPLGRRGRAGCGACARMREPLATHAHGSASQPRCLR